MTHHPKLRPLDIRPVDYENQPFLQVSDPQQLSAEKLLIPQPLAMVLAFCNGQRSIAGMVAAFERQYGMVLETEMVEELFEALDEANMLDNARTEAARHKVLGDYRRAPFRPPALAGRAYPADKTKLWQRLQQYLEFADVDEAKIDWSRPVGLLSPHIDFPRGGEVYAQVWKRAAQAVREAELVILLGTDHYGDDPFTLTRQHYATPYGRLPTAQPIIDGLVTVLGEEAAFAGELRHRSEHSLELVAVWLQHLRGGIPVPTVPILVGSLRMAMRNGHEPIAEQAVADVIDTLRSACEGQRTLIVASGDLSHVGPVFGGKPLIERGKAEIRAADYQLLKQIRNGDAAAFFQTIRSVDNRNNVCGVAPIYLTMQTLDPVRGEQFGYAICPADSLATSIVSVAGVMWS